MENGGCLFGDDKKENFALSVINRLRMADRSLLIIVGAFSKING